MISKVSRYKKCSRRDDEYDVNVLVLLVSDSDRNACN